MTSLTLSSILASQASLLQEASEALPHQFSQCTHPLGYIRQAVYLCRTCGETRGICSACSIACHTDHDQLELFPKRKFRCDCPTAALSHKCTLHHALEQGNAGNEYNQNFHSVFCRCGREYDAQQERETMIQCLSCEDWYHESCLNLRERPLSRQPTPEPAAEKPTLVDNIVLTNEDDDAHSEASSSGLPPPLITADSYESFVCSTCVRKIPTLQQYAGTSGVLMVVRDTPQQPWKVIGKEPEEDDDVDIHETATVVAGNKRPHPDPSVDGPEAKRPRPSEVYPTPPPTNGHSSPCLAPPLNPAAQGVLAVAPKSDCGVDPQSLGAGDVFLTDGWRERWCKCNSCLPSLSEHPFLLEEEETYEPPEDPDSGLSLEELGLRALQKLPRERAIDGIHAFNEMRDGLLKHLRPFAEQDKEVTEADIRAFFDEKLAAGR